MLTTAEKIVFAIFAATCLYFAWPGFRNLYLSIRRGQPSTYPRFDNIVGRSVDAILRTMRQGTVFKHRPVVSFFHALVVYGYVYYLRGNVFPALFASGPPPAYAGLALGWLGGLYRLGADPVAAAGLIGGAP